MDVFRFKTVAVIPAFVVASLPAEHVSDKVSPVVANADFSDSETLAPALTQGTSETHTSVRIHESPIEWTRQMEKHFEHLAILEASGEISPQEKTELEGLTIDRRNLKYPRTPQEVYWEYKQRQVTSNLVNAVRDYVQFHSVSNRQRGSS